jgi:hypothetical protein
MGLARMLQAHILKSTLYRDWRLDIATRALNVEDGDAARKHPR